MKKAAVILFISLTLILSACATPAGAATPEGPTSTPGIVAENYPSALPVPSQLAIGTIQLKDTANAVTKEDAANLLFLWKGLEAMSNTTGASQIEMNALLTQIQDTMKPTQLKAISDMKLTQADVQKVMASLPIAPGGAARAAGGAAGSTGQNRQQGGGGFGGGGFPGGGPGGAGTTGGNQSIPPSTQATIQARAAQRASQTNVLLYTAVVNYLQTLAPASAPAPAPTPTK